MSRNVWFDNNYKDYLPGLPQNVLNGTDSGISSKFHSYLENYITRKEEYILKEMQTDLFYDGTIYTGSAGLALYYFMINLSKNDFGSLNSLLIYLDIHHLKGKRISFLCGDAGPLALATVVSYKLQNVLPEDLPNYKILTDRLMSLISRLEISPDELLYGKSGYLFALLFVNKYVGKDIIPASHIEKVTTSILNSGKEFSAYKKSESPLLWQWHDKIYFGAAHGMAGILYMLLQAREYINSSNIENLVKPTLDWLLDQQFQTGNFPSSMGSSSGDRLVQWCHGAPGFVPLCILAHQIFKEEKYMRIAIKSGEVVWQRGLTKKGFSICHGVAGNAFAFMQLYQATKDPVQLYRASRFIEWSTAEQLGTELHVPDRPASLFEGLTGRIYAAYSLLHIENASFPAATV